MERALRGEQGRTAHPFAAPRIQQVGPRPRYDSTDQRGWKQTGRHIVIEQRPLAISNPHAKRPKLRLAALASFLLLAVAGCDSESATAPSPGTDIAGAAEASGSTDATSATDTAQAGDTEQTTDASAADDLAAATDIAQAEDTTQPEDSAQPQDVASATDTTQAEDTAQPQDTAQADASASKGACDNTADLSALASSDPSKTISGCVTSCISPGPGCNSCLSKGLGTSAPCTGCFAGIVDCTIKNCALNCISPTSKACTDCQNQKCFPAFVACAGVSPP